MFKKGDRVRCKESYGDRFTAGKLYEVRDVYAETVSVVEDDKGSKGNGWRKVHFEPVPVDAATSTYKVGDRVRLLSDEGERRPSGSVGKVGALTADTYLRVDFEKPFLGWGETNSWHVSPSLIEPAPLFAVGDKVRLREDNMGWGDKGDAGHIEETDLQGTVRVRFETGRWAGESLWAVPSFLEPAPVAASNDNATPAKFKVGDRVRCVTEEDGGGYTNGKEYIVSRVYTGDFGDDRIGTESDDDGDSDNGWGVSHFVHAAPLTIQAGRFYRTRDGRKVGPMREHSWNSQLYDESKTITRYGWHRNGGFYNMEVESHLDLISEWPAEPKATAPFILKGGKFSSSDGRVVIDGDLGTISIKLPNPAIVCLIENGQPKPSDRPHVHASKASASKEAARLANVYKGKEFGVYEFVSSVKRERVYDYEWQRLAASGERIPAIKAYRDAGGKRPTFMPDMGYHKAGYEDRHIIGLKEAKDAVEYWIDRNAA